MVVYAYFDGQKEDTLVMDNVDGIVIIELNLKNMMVLLESQESSTWCMLPQKIEKEIWQQYFIECYWKHIFWESITTLGSDCTTAITYIQWPDLSLSIVTFSIWQWDLLILFGVLKEIFF